MKRFYQIPALLLIAAALLLTGCVMRTGPMPDDLGERVSDPVTADSLLRVTYRRLQRLPSAELDVQATLDALEDTGRGMAEATMDVSLQGELLTDDLRLNLRGQLSMNVMDMTMDFPLELMAFREDDALNARVYVMDQWVTGSIPFPAQEPGELSTGLPNFLLDGEALRQAVLREEKETVGDRECYRVDISLRAGELGLPAGISAEQVPGWEELTYTAAFWVDVQTILPARLILSAEGPIGKEDYTMQRAEVRIDFTGFGTVEENPIPETANSSAEVDDGTGFSL